MNALAETEAPEPEIISARARTNERVTVDRLVARFKDYANHPLRLQAEEQWRQCDLARFGIKQHPGQYRIREIWRQCETLIPQLCKVLLDGEQLFTLNARQAGFDEQAEGATAIIHDQLHRYGSVLQLYEAVGNCVYYGKGYVYARWARYQQTRHKLTPMSAPYEQDTWARETQEVPLEAPMLESVPPWDLYTNPNIGSCKHSPLTVIRKGMSDDDLKTWAREGYIDGKALKDALETQKGTFHDDTTDWKGVDNWIDNEQMSMTDEDLTLHEILLCWTADGQHYIVMDQEFLLRAAPSEDARIPIHDLTNYPQTRRHYGIPEPWTILDGQRLMDELAELFVKQNWYGLPMWIVKDSMKKNFANGTFKPGGFFVGDPNDIGLLPQSEQGGAPQIANMIGVVKRDMQLTNGNTEEMAGTASNTGTATGIVRLQQAAGDRNQHKIAIMIPAFRDIYAHLYDLNAKYLNEEYELRITGQEGLDQRKKYAPGESYSDGVVSNTFLPNVDVDIEIGSSAGPEQANSILNAYKVLGQDPLVNRQEVIDEFFKASGMKKIKRFRSSSQNSQQDALQEGQLLSVTGIIAPVKPSDNHQVHMQIHQMQLSQLQQAVAQGTPEIIMQVQSQTQTLQGHLAEHQQFAQQMQQANAQAQQAQMQQGQQAQGIGQQANARTEGMFQNGQRGALQSMAAQKGAA